VQQRLTWSFPFFHGWRKPKQTWQAEADMEAARRSTRDWRRDFSTS